MERKDKLQLLKSLANGSASMDALKEKGYRVEVGDPTQYFINDKPVSADAFADAVLREKNLTINVEVI